MPLTTAIIFAWAARAYSLTTDSADPSGELCLLQLKAGNGEYDEKLEQLKAENEELKRKVNQRKEEVSQGGDAASVVANPLREKYLETVSMGLLGGLTHEAYTDPTRGGTTDYQKRNQCLTRDWSTGGTVDACILKWDAYERMKRVEQAYKDVQENGVAGDLIECGVWRGGITIWMKALLTAYGDTARNVWVSDSFSGVPNAARQEDHPEFKDIPSDMRTLDMKQWGGHVTEPGVNGEFEKKNILTVEGKFVEDNFKRFGLLDDKVKFLVGYFNDTLPTVRDKGLSKIAVLRVDGDLYSSTMDVLENLYSLVSPGGYVIFDDYPLPQSQRAILDFFKRQGLDRKLLKFDRITNEEKPAEFKGSGINQYAYFKKPLMPPQ
jgi:hypothetical protein